MHINKQKRVLLAWMLLATFMFMHVLKDVHIHHPLEKAGKAMSTNEDGPSAKGNCFICDFTLNQATQTGGVEFRPMISFVAFTLNHFEKLIVYRLVESVNSHYPPTMA